MSEQKPSRQEALSWRLHLVVAIVSGALLSYQIALMQMLSLAQWHHFASLVISIALLGFGVSGTLLALFRDRLLKCIEELLSFIPVVTGLCMGISYSLSQGLVGGFDPYLFFSGSGELPGLFLTCMLYMLPFVPGSLLIGLVFTRWTDQSGPLYFSNLAGSGVGAMLSLVFLSLFQPEQLAGIHAVMLVASGLVLPPRRHRPAFVLTSAAALAAAVLLVLIPPGIHISQYKDLSKALNLPESRIMQRIPGPHGIIHVVSSPVLRYAPGVSLAYEGTYPVRDMVYLNGSGLGPVVERSRSDTSSLLDYTTQAVAYEIADAPRVLILSAGAGTDIAHALARDAQSITALEPNTRLLALLRDSTATKNDSLFYDERLQVHATESRAWLAGDTSNYDIIIHPLVGSFGGGSGLGSLSEQYTLTVEAVEQFIEHLSPRGVLVFSAWMDYPHRSTLRLVSTLEAGIERSGLGPVQRHLAAVRSWGMMTFLVSRKSLTAVEEETIRRFCDRLLFDPILLPSIQPDERSRYNAFEDDALIQLDDLLSTRRDSLLASYPFDITPAVDDRPFFSQFLTIRSIKLVLDLVGRRAMPYFELGTILILVTTFVVTASAILLILLPLARLGFTRGGTTWTLVYFTSLGFAYMFFEIVLIQQFILFLGQPVMAAAMVIGGLLLCSGAGSLLSKRMQAGRRVLFVATAVSCVIIALYALVLQDILGALMHLSLPLKAVCSLVLISVPGFVMGMPFPLGLRYQDRVASRNVPWSWGINAAVSVAAAGIATLLALVLGFRLLMLSAAAWYLLATLVTSVLVRQERPG